MATLTGTKTVSIALYFLCIVWPCDNVVILISQESTKVWRRSVRWANTFSLESDFHLYAPWIITTLACWDCSPHTRANVSKRTYLLGWEEGRDHATSLNTTLGNLPCNVDLDIKCWQQVITKKSSSLFKRGQTQQPLPLLPFILLNIIQMRRDAGLLANPVSK